MKSMKASKNIKTFDSIIKPILKHSKQQDKELYANLLPLKKKDKMQVKEIYNILKTIYKSDAKTLDNIGFDNLENLLKFLLCDINNLVESIAKVDSRLDKYKAKIEIDNIIKSIDSIKLKSDKNEIN